MTNSLFQLQYVLREMREQHCELLAGLDRIRRLPRKCFPEACRQMEKCLVLIEGHEQGEEALLSDCGIDRPHFTER